MRCTSRSFWSRDDHRVQTPTPDSEPLANWNDSYRTRRVRCPSGRRIESMEQGRPRVLAFTVGCLSRDSGMRAFRETSCGMGDASGGLPGSIRLHGGRGRKRGRWVLESRLYERPHIVRSDQLDSPLARTRRGKLHREPSRSYGRSYGDEAANFRKSLILLKKFFGLVESRPLRQK